MDVIVHLSCDWDSINLLPSVIRTFVKNVNADIYSVPDNVRVVAICISMEGNEMTPSAQAMLRFSSATTYVDALLARLAVIRGAIPVLLRVTTQGVSWNTVRHIIAGAKHANRRAAMLFCNIYEALTAPDVHAMARAILTEGVEIAALSPPLFSSPVLVSSVLLHPEGYAGHQVCECTIDADTEQIAYIYASSDAKVEKVEKVEKVISKTHVLNNDGKWGVEVGEHQGRAVAQKSLKMRRAERVEAQQISATGISSATLTIVNIASIIVLFILAILLSTTSRFRLLPTVCFILVLLLIIVFNVCISQSVSYALT